MKTGNLNTSGRRLERHGWVVILSISAFVLAATAARDGHDWGGDYAQYILHAKNLLDGNPYTPIAGTIHNPYLDWMPPAYPPIYPLCIAAVIAVFGISFVALKIQIAAFLGLAVALYWPVARRRLPGPWALGAVCFLAFAPYLLKFSNKVLSEIPYMAVSFAGLIVADRFFEKKDWRSTSLLLLAMIAAGATRSLGLAFVLAVPAYALVAKRSYLVTSTLASMLTVLVLVGISWSMIGFYVEETGMSIERVLVWMEGKPGAYFSKVGRYLALYPNESASFALKLNGVAAAVYLVLVSLGLFKIRRLTVTEAYLAIYLFTIYVYAVPKTRYLFPVIPLLSLHAFQGLRFIWISIRKKARTPLSIRKWIPYAPTLLYTPLFLTYWSVYTFRPVTAGANILNDPNVSDLFDHFRSHRAEMQGAIFNNPRVMTLFTGVPATPAFNALKYWKKDTVWDLGMILDLTGPGGVSHLVLANTETATCLAVGPIVAQNPDIFEQTYENTGYKVYKIHSDSGIRAQLIGDPADIEE